MPNFVTISLLILEWRQKIEAGHKSTPPRLAWVKSVGNGTFISHIFGHMKVAFWFAVYTTQLLAKTAMVSQLISVLICGLLFWLKWRAAINSDRKVIWLMDYKHNSWFINENTIEISSKLIQRSLKLFTGYKHIKNTKKLTKLTKKTNIPCTGSKFYCWV